MKALEVLQPSRLTEDVNVNSVCPETIRTDPKRILLLIATHAPMLQIDPGVANIG
jgi:hypothetical protein